MYTGFLIPKQKVILEKQNLRNVVKFVVWFLNLSVFENVSKVDTVELALKLWNCRTILECWKDWILSGEL
jgi:hypothetical protein